MYGSNEKSSKSTKLMSSDEIKDFQGFGMAQRAIIDVFNQLDEGKGSDAADGSSSAFVEEAKEVEDDQIMDKDDEIDDEAFETATTISEVDSSVQVFVSIY